MEQYVLLRIMSLTGVDLNLFQFDRHNALYFFMMNADEHIYIRYGGRDAASATTYLDFDSLELALAQGLELHTRYQAGNFEPQERQEPLYPKDILTLKKSVIDNNRCVECHLVDDYLITEMETAGTLDKLQDMYASPDLHTLGIYLDIPRGLQIDRTERAATAAGLQRGDIITHLGNHAVYTFGDLQFRLDRVHRRSTELPIGINRDGSAMTVVMALPDQWWFTDLTHRYWSVDPLVFFNAERLSTEEKQTLDLPVDGFASRVIEVNINALLEGAHDLEEGDIIVAVDGVEQNIITQDLVTHIKLMHTAGNTKTLTILRGDEIQEMPLTSKRQRYRKRGN